MVRWVQSQRRRIDVATGSCTQVLDVNTVLGSRNLSFGGTGIWDDDGHFYAPVWTFLGSPPDTALLKVKVEIPERSLLRFVVQRRTTALWSCADASPALLNPVRRGSRSVESAAWSQHRSFYEKRLGMIKPVSTCVRMIG
jgi:hypothetical protein